MIFHEFRDAKKTQISYENWSPLNDLLTFLSEKHQNETDKTVE